MIALVNMSANEKSLRVGICLNCVANGYTVLDWQSYRCKGTCKDNSPKGHRWFETEQLQPEKQNCRKCSKSHVTCERCKSFLTLESLVQREIGSMKKLRERYGTQKHLCIECEKSGYDVGL